MLFSLSNSTGTPELPDGSVLLQKLFLLVLYTEFLAQRHYGREYLSVNQGGSFSDCPAHRRGLEAMGPPASAVGESGGSRLALLPGCARAGWKQDHNFFSCITSKMWCLRNMIYIWRDFWSIPLVTLEKWRFETPEWLILAALPHLSFFFLPSLLPPLFSALPAQILFCKRIRDMLIFHSRPELMWIKLLRWWSRSFSSISQGFLGPEGHRFLVAGKKQTHKLLFKKKNL